MSQQQQLYDGMRVRGPNGQQGVIRIIGGQPHLVVIGGQANTPLQPTAEAGLKDLQTEAQEAGWLAQKAQQFHQLQHGQPGGGVVGTGPQNGIPIVGNMLTEYGRATNPSFASMDSLSDQAWVHMRPSGSGSLKAPEIEGFKSAFPNVSNTPQANDMIEGRLQQDAAYAAQKLQFIDGFIRTGLGNYADATQAWQRSQDEQAQSAAPQQPVSQQALAPVPGNNQYGQPTAGPGYNGGPAPQGQPQPQQTPQPQQGQDGWSVVRVF